jgi:hypothetical protein
MLGGVDELNCKVILLEPGLEKFRQRRVGFSDKNTHGRSLKTHFWKGISTVCALLMKLSTKAPSTAAE